MKLTRIIIAFCFVLPLALNGQSRRNTPAAAPADTINPSVIAGLSFRNIGPAFTSGRIADIAVNPADHSEYYVAVASGHLWKTTNSGTTWQPIFDNYGAYSMGVVTIDPNNSNVIWLGTGENNHQRAVGYGNGVWKSTDGGKSWNNMGLKESRQTGGIVIDPRNSDVVFVAAEGSVWGPGKERGLYKTTDGGKIWKKVLEISENTGVNNVVIDSKNPDILYATSEQRRRHAFTKIGGGPESAFYKSTDNGETWRKIGNGLPSGHIGGMGLAVSPANSSVVYLIIEAEGTTGGFFRSTDNGESWTKMNSYTSSGQYYNEIVCDPVDADRVYSLETVTRVTTDGGKTWQAISTSKRHVDDHAMWIDPSDPRHFLIGGDGGIYETWDRGNTFLFKSNLPVTQFYRVGLDNDFPFYNVYGGTQDNNTLGGPSRSIVRSGTSNEEWYALLGGDGFWAAPDPTDPNIVYCEYQYGNMYRHDKLTKENRSIKPQPRKGEDTYKWNWDAPLMISPHSNTRLYTAANKVFRSDDRGESWQVISGDITTKTDRNSWPVMDQYWSIDAVVKDMSTSLWGTAVAIDESPVQQDLLYVGTDDGIISVTDDAGKNWYQAKKFPGVPEYSYISDICASPHDAGVVFASLRNLKRDDFSPYLLKSTDKGRTWISIASNLPKNGSVHTILQDHIVPDLLFAGTEFGVYVSINGGGQWIKMSSVPDVAVYDMAIQKRENDLVLATFGRGFYILDDYTALRSIAQKKDITTSPGVIFPVRDALMYIETEEKYGQGEALWHAPNPPFGATFTWYMADVPKSLKEKRQEAEKELFKAKKPIPQPLPAELRAEEEEVPAYLLFTIKDEAGNVIRKLTAAPQKGINRTTWDLRHESLEPVSAGSGKFNPLAQTPSGIPAMPGKYSVAMDLIVNGEVKQMAAPVSFTALMVDNSALPRQPSAATARFMSEFAAFSGNFSASVSKLNEAATSVAAMRQALNASSKATPQLASRTALLEKEINDIKFIINGSPAKASWEELPPEAMPLINRLYAVSENIWGSLHGVTGTMNENFIILKDEFPAVKQRIDKAGAEIKAIGDEMNRLNIPWTTGR